MIAFTILGLLLFWFWCFQIGYCLGFLAELLDTGLRVLVLEHRVRNHLSVYAGWLTAYSAKGAA